MFTYSSDQFHRDWKYATEKEFTYPPESKPYPYASNGSQEWGDEVQKLDFPQPSTACISKDQKKLAVAVKSSSTISIIDTTTPWQVSPHQITHAAAAEIEGLVFDPNNTDILLSSEIDANRRPTVRVWRSSGDGLETQVIINGRLRTQFGAHVFSPSGKWMTYLAGNPRANGVEPWDVVICRSESSSSSSSVFFPEHVVLRGHTDNVTWTGWNADESLLGSVSWDGTARIWDVATGAQVHVFTTTEGGQNWTGAFSKSGSPLLFAATGGRGTLHIFDLANGSERWMYDFDESRDWWRALDWHPNGRWLAVGGRAGASLLLLDVEEKRVLQERRLSARNLRPDQEEEGMSRLFLNRWLEVSTVKFVDGGRKLAFWSTGDSSVEVLDIAEGTKWRFARGGTNPDSERGEWVDDRGKVTSQGGKGMLVWDDEEGGQTVLVSIDFDGLRVWKIPASTREGLKPQV
ncbi:WD40 repeat-like protein [Poronia punctata]|nr:WD40 repeat-like protein [Poronia punctata]